MRLFTLLFLIFSLQVSTAAAPLVESFDKMNEPFPNLVFTDPAGKPAKVSDYKGEVVLVKLWATWCGICRKKWPEHQALYDEVKNIKGVRIVTLSIMEDQDVSQAWVDKQGYTVPLYRNPITDRGAVKVADDSLFFINGTPMKFLIDKDGILQKKVVGAMGSISVDDIRKLL